MQRIRVGDVVAYDRAWENPVSYAGHSDWGVGVVEGFRLGDGGRVMVVIGFAASGQRRLERESRVRVLGGAG